MREADETTQLHIPVLVDAVLQYLRPQKGESYLDLTAGYGGHATQVLELTQTQLLHMPDKTVLVDRDGNAVRELEKVFAEGVSNHSVEILQTDFYSASQTLQQQGRQFDMILADLGVSSPHLNDADRGFAIAQDGPLDMRMDQTQTLSAADIVNTYSEDAIATLLKDFGEEPKARQIARSIVRARPLTRTADLAAVVAKAWPGYNKVHPATRTFQALRIAVNDELRQVQAALPIWQSMLAPGGRLAVISFHSLEDRIVKRSFAESSDRSGDRYDTDLQLLTKRPVTASPQELVHNPRARSAKLRAVLKQK